MDVLTLLPQFGGLLYTICAFVIALSVIVAVHEYGHYIVARWSGIHAEVFSLGFGPVLFSRVDRHGTRWQVALLPFGGYVKFLGDADATSGKDLEAIEAVQDDPAALRRTMHGAPLWARAATVAAGPVFNFILSILVFASLAMIGGKAKDPVAIGELAVIPGIENQLQVGDELLSIEGLAVPASTGGITWRDYSDALPIKQPLTYLVRRDGRDLEVQGPHITPSNVSRVLPRSAAADAGLREGDVITALDGQPVFAFQQLKDKVEGGNGEGVALTVWRAGETLEMTLVPRRMDEPQPDGSFQTHWRIGVSGGSMFQPATERAGFGESVSAGAQQVWGVISMSLSGLSHMISGQISTCNLSGPIGIAETSSDMASQGAGDFIRFIAVLSTAVGMLNLFPVPALDGGHLMFYAYEAATGRKPNDRVMQILMTIGIAAILSLMVFALGNDIFC